jgi:hypothetical protein
LPQEIAQALQTMLQRQLSVDVGVGVDATAGDIGAVLTVIVLPDLLQVRPEIFHHCCHSIAVELHFQPDWVQQQRPSLGRSTGTQPDKHRHRLQAMVVSSLSLTHFKLLWGVRLTLVTA